MANVLILIRTYVIYILYNNRDSIKILIINIFLNVLSRTVGFKHLIL